MLPLGRRVQDKLEGLIDKHMFQLGALSPQPFLTKNINDARCFETGLVVNIFRGLMGEEWEIGQFQ